MSHSNSTIRGLFVSDITRDIPPVVYFHEQSPDKLAAEVSEYIITGGHEVSSADHRRVPRGIHDEYVQLLETIAADRAAKTDLPAAWVSGFYGSGKSSFAKLLGLALDGLRAPAGPIRLPDGRALHEAWLARDLTARAEQLHTAWQRLIADLRDPIAVVFDLGATARDREHVHAVCVRQLQAKLGYCPEPLVAEFELRIENAGEWARFDALAREQLGKPWAEAARRPFAEEEFSALMARMYPDRYRDPMSWFSARGGTQSSAGSGSPEQAVQMILDMLAHRRPHAEVFFVIDEVSQYIHTSQDRVDRLRAFATAFGAASRGKHWIIAIGQQKLDEDAGESWLAWAKDRFPARLRVHLATNNIRDVVHRRLLQKTPAGAERLRELYARHRPELQLSGYGSAGLGADAFAEVYPLLPDHVDLIMRITSAMRLRSRRTQGDDAAIRGLLQALGELFRSQHFAEREVGELVTLEHLYEIQHTSLDADVQNAMARIHTHCANQPKQAGAAMLRAAKAVALLELIQDVTPTEETLVAQCLYARLGAGSNLPEVHDALEALRAARLLSYSEKLGYGIQSLAGEDWLRERDEYDPASDEISRRIHDELAFLLGSTPAAKLEGRAFPWSAHFSDELRADDVSLVSVRDHGSFELDFRLRRHDHDGDAAKHEEHAAWLRRSSESLFVHRLVWVVGARKALDDIVVDALRTTTMVRKYKSRVGSLPAPRQRLFFEEESREMELTEKVREAVAAAWMDGHMYLRGRAISPSSLAKEFKSALSTAAQRLLPELYPHFVAVTLTAGEFAPLLAADPSGISPKLTEGLGIFEKEGKRYVPACKGVVPGRIAEFLRSERHPPSGAVLLAHFGGPPFGYTAEVIKACVAGLLRAGRIRIALEGVGEITAIRDAGVHDLFEKDRDFKRATIAVVGKDDEIGFSTRARICKVIEPMHAHETTLEREDHAIADAVTRVFPGLASRTRALLERLQRLPTLGKSKLDPVLVEFEQVVNTALRSSRQTKATLLVLKQGIDTLSSGHELLARLDAQVTDARVDELRASHELLVHQLAQLDELHGRQPLVDMPAIAAAGAALREGLAAARPWEFELQLRGPAEFLRRRYVDERRRLLAWQQARVESVRAELQQREGFAALPAAKAHDVIRPIIAALHDTTDDAIAPTLLVLADTFTVTLDERSKDAQRRLDQLLSEALAAPIRTLELHLRDREVGSEAEVEALLAELRERLLDQIRSGVRVRLT